MLKFTTSLSFGDAVRFISIGKIFRCVLSASLFLSVLYPCKSKHWEIRLNANNFLKSQKWHTFPELPRSLPLSKVFLLFPSHSDNSTAPYQENITWAFYGMVCLYLTYY